MNKIRMACRMLAGAVLATLNLAWAVAPSQAADANGLMMKALGTTDESGPVLTESFKRAAMDLTPEQRALALKCWKASTCETGHGTVTVAYADGFGENVWRQVTKME